MKKTFILFHIFFVTLFFLQAKEFEKIEFKGDGQESIIGDYSRTSLLKVIGIEYPPFYTFWRKDPTFDDKNLPEYEKLLTEYFQSFGYYKVNVNASTNDDTIEINIQRNEPIKVDTINLTGSAGLRNLILFRQGEVFQTKLFKDSKALIERYMVENGSPKYDFGAKAYVDLEAYKVNLDFQIDQNALCSLGDTTIFGKSDDIDEEILREQITYKEGGEYNLIKLENTYENIYNLGVYEYILVDPKLDINDTEIPIEIHLRKGETKFLKSSIGYSTDDGVRGNIAWTDNNFFGNLKVFEIGAKGSSEHGYELYNIFYDPRVEVPFFKRVAFENKISYSQNIFDSYDEKLWENKLTFGKTAYGLEHSFGLLTQYSDIEIKVEGLENEEGNYFINALFYEVVLDKRDSKTDAKNGYFLSLYLEQANSVLGSDLDYFKYLAEARYIKTFYNDITIALKTRVGSISDNVPLFKHYFSGGSFTNRGYEYQNIGKKDPTGDPLGGESLIDASLELRYPVYKELSLAAFYDTSMIAGEGNQFDEEFYDSAGFGMRYKTPIGPFRLDFGFPLQESGWEFHISIGQIF